MSKRTQERNYRVEQARRSLSVARANLKYMASKYSRRECAQEQIAVEWAKAELEAAREMPV